jgi:hypothetical protein
VLGVLAVAFWWDAYLSGAVLAGLSFGATGKVGFAQDATTDELAVGLFGLATQPALVAILARYSGRWADCLMACDEDWRRILNVDPVRHHRGCRGALRYVHLRRNIISSPGRTPLWRERQARGTRAGEKSKQRGSS